MEDKEALERADEIINGLGPDIRFTHKTGRDHLRFSIAKALVSAYCEGASDERIASGDDYVPPDFGTYD